MTSGSEKQVLDLRSVFGVEAIVTTPSAGTDGAYIELDCVLHPGGKTAIHYHPEQEETYQVLDGTLEVFSEGRWKALSAGEALSVPERAVHGFRNASGTPVRFLNVHRPALNFQEHLETLDRLVRDRKIKGLKDPRSLIYMSMASTEQEPSVTIKPPQWLLKGLAFVGRRLGFRLE